LAADSQSDASTILIAHDDADIRRLLEHGGVLGVRLEGGRRRADEFGVHASMIGRRTLLG
jgi:hypothetical protein